MFGLSSSVYTGHDSDSSDGEVIDEERLALWKQQFVLRSGFMIKQGAIAKTWKRRYFELLNSGELLYYEDLNKNENKPLGMLSMSNVRSTQLLELNNGFGFSLETDAPKRVWYFVCDSKFSRNEWHNVILKILTINKKKKQLSFNRNVKISKNQSGKNNNNNGTDNDDIASNYKMICKDLSSLEKNWQNNFSCKLARLNKNGTFSIKLISFEEKEMNSFLNEMKELKIELRLYEQQLLYVNNKSRKELTSIDDSYVIFERIRILFDNVRQGMIDIDVVLYKMNQQIENDKKDENMQNSTSNNISHNNENKNEESENEIQLNEMKKNLDSKNELISKNDLKCVLPIIDKKKEENGENYNVKVFRNSILIYHSSQACLEWRFGNIESIHKRRYQQSHEIKMKNKEKNELRLTFDQQSDAQQWYDILVESIRPFHQRPKKKASNDSGNNKHKASNSHKHKKSSYEENRLF